MAIITMFTLSARRRAVKPATRPTSEFRGLIRAGLRRLLVGVLCWGLATTASAVIETYEFDNEQLRERYNTFTEVLRCPKCQNQNLSGSNSPIAADLRRELHRLLQEGRSDAEIRDYMVARYGEFILYQPPLNRHTVVLWFFPLVLLAIGAAVLLAVVRRRGGAAGAAGDDAAVREQAASLLQQFGGAHAAAPSRSDTPLSPPAAAAVNRLADGNVVDVNVVDGHSVDGDAADSDSASSNKERK